MARRIDLTGENVTRARRKGQQYGTKTDLSSTAVDRGDTHWMNDSRVSIDGVLDVTGLTTISGTLNVSGTTTLSGATTIAGPTGITGALTIAGQLDVTGPTTLAGTLGITGDTSVTGALDIEGITTLTGNMDVIGGGKITVGNVILSPSAANGGVEFAGGGGVGGNGGTVLMRGSANAGFLALETTVASVFAGANQLNVSELDITLGAPLINLNAPQTSVNGNLVVTGSIKAGTDSELSQVRLRVGALPNMVGGVPNVRVEANGVFYRCT